MRTTAGSITAISRQYAHIRSRAICLSICPPPSFSQVVRFLKRQARHAPPWMGRCACPYGDFYRRFYLLHKGSRHFGPSRAGQRQTACPNVVDVRCQTAVIHFNADLFLLKQVLIQVCFILGLSVFILSTFCPPTRVQMVRKEAARAFVEVREDTACAAYPRRRRVVVVVVVIGGG